MTNITQMQTRTDEEFAKLTDDEIIEKYFDKEFNYDGLAGLTDRELDDWINDYVSHLPETHNLQKYEVPCMVNKKLKRIIRDHI
jgi:hypothetical protein